MKIENKIKPLIFVVEDIPRNLQIVCNMLKKEGYRIGAAGSGKQALGMIEEAKPDLVLLDVMMPEMDGFEVCEQLKKNPATKDIPVIFLTAKTEITDIVKGFEAGAVDYVTKPFNSTELLTRVKTHLQLKFTWDLLRELIATRDKFFAIIAHDLINPLQALIFSADLLHSSYDSLDDEMRKEYIKRFYNNSTQIAALLENLLDWSSAQRGKIPFHPGRIDLGFLAGENVDLLKENAKKKNISVSLEIAPETIAFGDENMIRAVIRNLLSNALKFTEPGGEVRISASKPDGNDKVEITVSDNGIGINEEEIQDFFRIDVRHNSRGTANEKGTGLGLILCKEFVEKNNGTIKVTSVPGSGSSFTFTLPSVSRA
jgi:signal transduction histidine kinase